MLTFALTIVRHGETQYNRDKLLQGQGIDTLLSDTGHQQAAAAGQYLRDLHFTNVFVSNLQRAVQTAEIILGNNLHSSAAEMTLDPLLRERVKTRFKKFLRSLYQRMLEEHGLASSSGPSEAEPPVIAGLADDGVLDVPVHALIVSHGAFIRVSVRHLVEDLQCCLPAGLKMNQIFSPCPNTGISRFIISLRREESGPRASRIQCIFINRKDHLHDIKKSD
ncbi:fructose-2,6-bisphosphatase TIGAR B isoform X2 [Puntigrus tetrazona]|uniref:fructose-2,6-bisphosphatase TIGAR B isoform X2 n=1 Tax=Puntigrus tetrazona TaxID=1606681 RepID=UPI001C893222|nr:fructose-2,6-bisphosphatase TIGAR B isoform X2 [Puntigrus tetrazona]